MNNRQPAFSNSIIYYRLIALWVLNEAMLGGIIHGLRMPVSGLIVGSCAVICICLIAWYAPGKGSIIKATIIVAIFKMMLSPQSPAPAYIAVFFQGLVGELLFWNKSRFKLCCLLLATLALLESAMQRIFSLVIFYGNDFWTAFNDFINKITGQRSITNYSLLLAAAYVSLHLIVGIWIGWWASGLPAGITKWQSQIRDRIVVNSAAEVVIPVSSKRRRRLKTGLLIVWILLILLYVQSYFKIGTPLLPSHIALKILLRSLIIVLAWIFLVSPLLKRVLHFWLQKKQSRFQNEIQQVMQLLPSTRQLITESWKQSSGTRGAKRIKNVIKLVLVNALSIRAEGKIVMLTGPIQTGKTSSLVSWSEKRNDVHGILTPVVQGKRMFMDLMKRHLFAMEAAGDETEALRVGRFAFSKTGFERAIRIIREAIPCEGRLVIDEIGPLELKGNGFHDILKEVLSRRDRKQNLLLVAREGVIEDVRSYFGLEEALIITSLSVLES
jgi:nucleoside-triphosphatase THEP1